MNQNTLLQMKQKYEEKLVSTLAEALKFNPENISAIWSIDKTEINIKLSANKDITTYNFIYTENNLIATMSHYSIIVDSNNIITGVEAQKSNIDLNTMVQLHTLITQTLTDKFEPDPEYENSKDTSELAE